MMLITQWHYVPHCSLQLVLLVNGQPDTIYVFISFADSLCDHVTSCTTLRRLYVQNATYDSFVGQLVRAYKSVKIGNPLEVL
jgi:hypothetical protein